MIEKKPAARAARPSMQEPVAVQISATTDKSKETKPEPAKKFPLRLLKNHQPKDGVEVLDAAEPPYAGVGQDGRLWAGSLALFPLDEAKRLVAAGIAERADDME